MPRTARAPVGGFCYHVGNRGNARAEVFHHEGDYFDFVDLIRDACARMSIRLLAYCLLPKRFHLAAWPEGERDLSDWIALHAHGARSRLPQAVPWQRPQMARPF